MVVASIHSSSSEVQNVRVHNLFHLFIGRACVPQQGRRRALPRVSEKTKRERDRWRVKRSGSNGIFIHGCSRAMALGISLRFRYREHRIVEGVDYLFFFLLERECLPRVHPV